MQSIYKQFSYYSEIVVHGYTLQDGRVELSSLETDGDSLAECIDNAVVGLQDWHGNDLGHKNISELPENIYLDCVAAIVIAIDKQINADSLVSEKQGVEQ